MFRRYGAVDHRVDESHPPTWGNLGSPKLLTANLTGLEKRVKCGEMKACPLSNPMFDEF